MTVVNLRRTVVVDGEVIGVLASTITVKALSEFVTGLETELGQNAFVLYDREFVLAHSTLALDFPDLSLERPLPRITEIGDPVLFEIWHEGWQKRPLRVAGTGHWHRLGDAEYLYLYRNLEPPLDARWLVGSYFAAEAVDTQLDRLLLALGLGLLALIVAGDRRRAARPPGQPADRPARRGGERDPHPRPRRPRPAAALAPARDRPGGDRVQRHGADLARVRGLCAASRSCRA